MTSSKWFKDDEDILGFHQKSEAVKTITQQLLTPAAFRTSLLYKSEANILIALPCHKIVVVIEVVHSN